MPKPTKTPHVRCLIRPTAVYTRPAVMKMLYIPEHALRAAERRGELRVAIRCRRRWYTGRWLLDWITSGERKRAPEANGVLS